MMTKSGIKLFLTLGFSLSLAGCSVYGPAPVSDLSKDYHAIPRGSYRGSFYTVKKGDTLYYIAYITDKDVKDIIHYNQLSRPYTIYPGQRLKLWRPAYVPPKYGKPPVVNSSAVVASATNSAKKTSALTKGSLNHSKNEQNANNSQNKYDEVKTSADKSIESSKSNGYGENVDSRVVKKKSPRPTETINQKIDRWLWPTKGRVIKRFSSGDQGNKGIDIAGRRGQSIVSAAAGTVVYSGNALRGYGNLVIVKHNDKYLSAYAHNDRLLVKEGQNVNAGQKIATMGSSGTNSIRLHFEIRYQGKSVNPTRYLP